MKAFTIRLSDETTARLERRAKAAKRSRKAEVELIVETALTKPQPITR